MKLKEKKINIFSVLNVLRERVHDLNLIHSRQKEIESALRYSEEQYRVTLDSMADAIHVVGPDLSIILFNKTFKKWMRILGLNTDIVGKNIYQAFPFLTEEVAKEYEQVFTTSEVLTTVETNRIKDTEIITETRKIPVLKDGRVIRVVTVIKDITESKRTKEKLVESEREKKLVLNSICEHIIYHSPSMQMIWANKAAADSVGLQPEDLTGKYCYKIWHGREEACLNCPVVRARDTGLAQEHEIASPDGRVWFIKGYPVKNSKGQVTGMVETTLEITKRKNVEDSLDRLNRALLKSNERMRKLIMKDALTNLYNLKYLHEIIEPEFSRAARLNQPLSLIIFDIDYFKSINEVYGHVFGDLILRQIARQLKKIVRSYDIVVRSGGEEFAVLCPATSKSTSLNLAQRILDMINVYEFGSKKQKVKFAVSIAVISYPDDRIFSNSMIVEGKDLINSGYKILSKTKESGGNRVFSCESLTSGKNADSGSAQETENTNLLKEKLERLTKQANQSLIESVFAFARTIELKDHYTGEHVEKTVQYAVSIAQALILPSEEVERVRQAAILHDLGKIGISEKILRKTSTLTKKEYDIIKKHPQIGVDIIRPIHALHDLIPYILYHHERWNGKGYPYGLKGEDIPLGARIVAIADVYQALISNRPYRAAYSDHEAMDIIDKCSGYDFDPEITKVFLDILK
ncbi:MAG: diguanylate cyclase [Candidatus Omnitrophica bacterium]|nr:diguanylate cyclase [Candidatus Omnitrophota bacterium]